MNKKDINNKQDVELLISSFYSKVLSDKEIGHFFKETFESKWDEHIEKITDFWSTILLKEISYKGNPVEVHIELAKKELITKTNFERWIVIFTETIDSLFIGERAKLAKYRAVSIASIMNKKISKAS